MEIPRLHPDTIEEVKQRVDIVDVISEYVVLRKRGKDYLGLCPFHDEKTPSFSVSPTKQLYYCFGCSAGGNAFKFLMELGKQSFSDVVLDLARRYQVSVKTLEPQQRQELQRQLSQREQLYEVLALAASFYQHALHQPQGKPALIYLKQKRQLREDKIQQFQLGYAPGGWETLYRYLVEQKRYPVDLAEEAGLIKQRKSGGGYYDQFRDRLMIPIQDTQGRIIGFGSRTLGADEPKYLNSPETTLFNKSKTLFALDKARNSISKQDQAVVVEGYFDAIALHQAEITNVVASLGTALTQDQLRLLLRYTESKQIIFNFDADRAGIQATQRAIREIEPLIYSGQVQLRVLNLPDGKDADEFLKSSPEGSQNYRQLLTDSSLWLDWQIKQLLVNRDLQQADQFQQVAQEMVKLLSKIEKAELRDRYTSYCAQLLALEQSQYFKLNPQDFRRIQQNLFLSIKQKRRQVFIANKPQTKPQLQPLTISGETSLLEEAEALLLRIYLHCPEHRQEIVDALEEKDLLFSLSHHRFLWQEITKLQDVSPQQVYDQFNQLIAALQERSFEIPESIAQVEHLFHLDEKTTEDIFRAPLRIRSAIASLEWVACEKYRRYCLEQWQSFNPLIDVEKMTYYYQELQDAERKIKELEECRINSED